MFKEQKVAGVLGQCGTGCGGKQRLSARAAEAVGRSLDFILRTVH